MLKGTTHTGSRAAEAATPAGFVYELSHIPNDEDVDSDGNTLLHRAAMQNQEEIVAGLCTNKGSSFDVDMRNREDKTALMLAARQGHESVVNILVRQGSDVNALQRSTHWSVLHEAALGGNSAVVKMLLEKGARITKATWKTAEDPSLENAHYPQKGDDLVCSPLIPGCIRGNNELIQLLILAGDDPHQVTNQHTNALHYCAAANPELCRWFLKDLHVNPNVGRENLIGIIATPIHYINNKSLLSCFFENGAVVDTFNERGDTFLWYQCGEKGDPQMALLALQNGANINHPSYIGKLDVENSNGSIPLRHFTNSLSKGVDCETTSFYSGIHIKTTVRYRDLDPVLVESLVREFIAKGAKVNDWIIYDIRNWMEKSKKSSPFLTQMNNKHMCITLFRMIVLCECIWGGMNRDDCNPMRNKIKVCFYTLGGVLMISAIAAGCFGLAEGNNLITGVGGGTAVLTGCTLLVLSRYLPKNEPRLMRSSLSYGSV